MARYPFQPDFNELLCVLNRQRPSRPVLFELFMNPTVYELMAGHKQEDESEDAYFRLVVDAFCAGGYDYATIYASGFAFSAGERNAQHTISLNEGFIITDEKSFEDYEWPNPESFDYSRLDKLGKYMPDGMKLLVMGPGGVLENVITLVGYENLCYMMLEKPELVQQIFDEVGSRMLRYYQIAAEHEAVGLIMSNDDWGFNTQTFLSPSDMRRLVFPWHTKIVKAAHDNKKPVALHSCGYMEEIVDDIIETMKYDGKHSYEDKILPVEESYRRWGGRIGILGGIDVNFLIKSSLQEIRERAAKVLELTQEHGSYALGSGNSIPEYVPYEHYRAMIDVALEMR